MYQVLRTTARRLLKGPRDQFLLAGAVAYLLALEAVGRQVAQGALGDLFLSSALVVGGAWLAVAHSRRSISWITVAIRGLRGTIGNLRRHTYRIGWDLRREPAIPHRVPPVLLCVVAGCEALVLGSVIWVLWRPIPARDLIGGITSVGFAAAQFVLWSALLGIICGLLLAGPALLRDLYVCRRAARRDQRRRVHSSWFFLLFAAMISAGLCFLPVWGAILILSGSFLLSGVSIWLPPRREFDFIWQPRGRAVVFSMSWRTYVSLMNSISILLCLFVLLLAVGPEALGLPSPAAERMSVSHLLGVVASWVAATGAVVFLWPMAYLELTTKRRDPACPVPTRVRVLGAGALTRLERTRIRDALNRRGWQVGFGERGSAATDVAVIAGDESPSAGGDSDWPRRISPARLDDEALYESIVRRDQVQRRRVFLRTLQTLLKRARRRRYEKSTGFWIAPQYWFVLGLTRDTGDRGRDEQETALLEVIPPLYHHAFPRAARAHFHDVCRAVEIDLIFLEDGVQWFGLRRVLRMMFEHYDVHGGSRRIEELHFTGVPRVRVVIHEFELGAEWERGQYPEPDFEDLARARVLHVFRDRGEEEVPRETPLDWDHLPSPVPAGTLA